MLETGFVLRVSYGQFSQSVVDLPLPLIGKANSLIRSANGELSLKPQTFRGSKAKEAQEVEDESIVLAQLFLKPARLQIHVVNVTVEAPPSILDGIEGDNQFLLPLDCFVLFTPGIILDFTDVGGSYLDQSPPH